jgi:hypothetical protein
LANPVSPGADHADARMAIKRLKSMIRLNRICSYPFVWSRFPHASEPVSIPHQVRDRLRSKTPERDEINWIIIAL